MAGSRLLVIITASAIAAIGVLSQAAHAAPIYDNVNVGTDAINGPSTFDPIASDGPLFNSFSTGLSDFVSDEIDLVLSAGNSDDNGSFIITVLADALGSPDSGNVILSSGPISDSLISTDPFNGGLYSWTFAPTDFAANTSFWVEVADECTATDGSCTPTSVSWAVANDASGTGVDGNTNGSSGSFAANDAGSPPFEMVVPEPAAISVLGLGLLGLGWFRRRRAVQP